MMAPHEVMAWLEQRVRADGECLVWVGCTNSAGHPTASLEGRKSVAVRPWLWSKLKRPLQNGRRLVVRCDNLQCLNLAHARPLWTSQINREIAARGGYTTPARQVAARRNGSAASPYGDEIVERVRELRAAGHTLEQIEQATGVPLTTASRWCRLERRTPCLPAASAFTFRGAP